MPLRNQVDDNRAFADHFITGGLGDIRFMRLKLIMLLLSLSPMVIWAQAWISAGVGGALPYAYPAYSVSGSLNVKNFPLKLRLGGIWDGDAESLEEEAILFGHKIPTGSKIFYIGLSNINGHRRGAILPDPNPGSWLHFDKYEKVYYKSMGLTLELESLNKRGSLFKFGYALIANLNKETPYVSALITLNIGSFLK